MQADCSEVNSDGKTIIKTYKEYERNLDAKFQTLHLGG